MSGSDMAADDMLLPIGKTCGDCANWQRCEGFIGSLKPTNTRCDWSPSAFRPAETQRSSSEATDQMKKGQS